MSCAKIEQVSEAQGNALVLGCTELEQPLAFLQPFEFEPAK